MIHDMKISIRSFKYGDAWLVSIDGRNWLEIPAMDGEAREVTNKRAVAVLRSFAKSAG